MAAPDPSKKVADRYLKREVLGEGTYGVVYKAIDTHVISRNFLLQLCEFETEESIFPLFAFMGCENWVFTFTWCKENC